MKTMISFAFILLLIMSACEQEDKISSPDKLSGLDKVTFKYDYLNTTPQYYQSLMMTGSGTELYIYGAYSGFFVYSLSADGWSKTFSFPNDTVGWRWDGAIGYLNGKVYVIATPAHSVSYDSFPKYYNILEVDPNTGSFTALPELLPFRRWSYYPAYGTYNGKLVVIFQDLDSVYVFNSNTKKGTFVAQNILKMSVSNNFNPVYSYGTNDEYLYVYKNSTKEFCRFSMQSYKWEKIEINPLILSLFPSHARGGMFQGLFCLWGATDTTLVYSSPTNKWMKGKIDLSNYDFLLNENSFFATNEALYVVGVFSRNLWRITLAGKSN